MSLLPGGSTEWEDIQVRLGNFAPRVASPSRDQVEAELLDAAEQVDVLAKSSLKTLERLIENDGGDDDELREFERIRNARLEELQRQSAALTFGRVIPGVTRQNFIDQVTTASVQTPVVCLMFSHRSVHCGEMARILDFLAKRHPSIKFVSGLASEILGSDQFPDANLPYVVFYKHGQCTEQLPRARPEQVARIVAALAPTREASDEEEEEDISGIARAVVSRAYKDNDDDREYSSQFFNRHVLRRR